MRKRTVRVTANFEQNLDEIRDFLRRQEAPPKIFEELLDYLFDTVIPNLQRFPELGVDFLARTTHTLEAHDRVQRLRHKIGSELQLREYIAKDYLILYAVAPDVLYLLAVKHHRQLSFDFKGHWLS
jgi:plasmid stabilization system protein ParE